MPSILPNLLTERPPNLSDELVIRQKEQSGTPKLDVRRDDIQKWVNLGLSATAIAKHLQISRTAIAPYLKTRKIVKST